MWYTDAKGRPFSLLRAVTWPHTLPTFVALLLALSPKPPLVTVARVAEVVIACGFMIPMWLAPAPWRHVSAATVVVIVGRIGMWIHEMLSDVFAATRVCAFLFHCR